MNDPKTKTVAVKCEHVQLRATPMTSMVNDSKRPQHYSETTYAFT